METFDATLVHSNEATATSNAVDLSRYVMDQAKAEAQAKLDPRAPAPSSAGQRMWDVTKEGMQDIPQGFINSLDPHNILPNVGMGFAIAAVTKVVLPESGPVAKVAGGLMGAYFMGKPLVESYDKALTAHTMGEMHQAASLLGNAIGGLPVSMAEGAIGAKLGAGLTGELLATRAAAPFVEWKANQYAKLDASLAGGVFAVQDFKVDNTVRANDLVDADKQLGFKPRVRFVANNPPAEVSSPPEVNNPGGPITELQGQQKALYNQFNPALERYHTGGLSNGGGVDGIQLPPKVSEARLQPFIEKLSTFLAKQDGIDEKEPAKGQPDSEFRTQLEKEAASAVQAHQQLYMDTGVQMIKSPVIHGMVEDALRQAPPEFFTSPSSSSGKYHPADEVNRGGLSLHSLRGVNMGAKLIDFFNQDASQNEVGNQNLVGDQRDLILGALLLHDIEKGGTPWNKYDPAHGPLGATYLEGVWENDPHQSFALKMEELVNNHMAQWNKAPNHVSDPKPPLDIPNQIVSYADYLGSQPNVFVQPFKGRDN